MASFKTPKLPRNTSKSRNKYSMDNYKLLVHAYFEEKYTKKNLINETKLDNEMIKFYAYFNTNKQRKLLDDIYKNIEKSYLPTPPKGDTPPLNDTPPTKSSIYGTAKPPPLQRTSRTSLRGAGKKSRRKNTKKRKLTKKKNRKGQKS